MIQANELRIWNLVSFYGENVKVTSIDGESIGINIITIDYPLIMEIEPIQLTEGWLLKFGFDEKYGRFVKSGLRLTNINNIYFRGMFPIKSDITSVHQLQNLYFALTQTELELKQI